MNATTTYRIWAADPESAASFAIRHLARRERRPRVLGITPIAHDPQVSDHPTLYRVELAVDRTASTRWTLYGLPGGYLTCWNASDDAMRSNYDGRGAVPLITFRASPADVPARISAAKAWALFQYDL